MAAGAVTTLREPVESKTHQVARDKTRPAHHVVDKRRNSGRVWTVPVGERTDIPTRALKSYAVAQERVVKEKPGCGLKWSTLAGIGAVESDHGRFEGRSVRSSGRPSAPIIGISLDGGPNIKAIRDTDNGELDRDTRWDRAIGPLQFIPSTWALVGADGDGDGRKDPQDMDDAAVAAARYLCRASTDLGSADGQRKAILAYNASRDYLHQVRTRATDYAAASHN
jgi:membrane-bound lytic murein transglycosylase B